MRAFGMADIHQAEAEASHFTKTGNPYNWKKQLPQLKKYFQHIAHSSIHELKCSTGRSWGMKPDPPLLSPLALFSCEGSFDPFLRNAHHAIMVIGKCIPKCHWLIPALQNFQNILGQLVPKGGLIIFKRC